MVIGTPTVLNLIPGKIFPVVNVNQYDAGYQKTFLLYKGAEQFNVATDMAVTIRGTKGDKKGITDSVASTAGSNLVSVTLTEQMTAVAGPNIYELRIADMHGLLVGTVNFVLMVEPAALGDDTVISDSDLNYAVDVLDKIQTEEATKNQVDANTTQIAALQEEDLRLQSNIDGQLDHFGTFHDPYMVVYGDIAFRGRWSSAQGLVAWGNYFVAINAYDSADGGAISSANGCDIIVLNRNLQVLQHYEAKAVGHGGGSCVLNDKLYICGDVYDFKYIITEVDLADLVAGTWTATQLQMDHSNPIYSIATDGEYLYGSNGRNIWRFTPSTSSAPTLQCRLPISTTQDITIEGTNLFVVSYTSSYQRNRIEVFDLQTGDYIDEILMPYRMGAEYKEIQTILNIGREHDPRWLVYFNSDSSSSNYILQIQFRRSLTTAISTYVNDSFLPYPFTDRDDSIFYKPSYHGIMYGSAQYPYNSENLVQRAIYEANRYCYIRVMEDIDSLTIISANRQLYIGSTAEEDYNHAIGNLNLYYCDIVDVVCPVTTITAYKVNVLQYSNSNIASASIDYVGRFIADCPGLRVTHTRNSHIESLRNIYISDNINSTLEWQVLSDGIDCTRNVVTGVVHKDNAGETNGTPTASRGILEIKTNVGLPVRYEMATFKFTTITGLVFVRTFYRAAGASTWTKTAWTQIQPVVAAGE